MPSTLACLGLSVGSTAELDDLLDRMPAEDHGSGGGVRILRHVDAGSLARVVVGVRGGEAVDLVPSLDAPIGALLGRLTRQGEHVAADVLDPDTSQVVTRLLGDLEQYRCLPGPDARHAIPDDVQWPTSVVALGVDVAVHADAGAFRASQDGDGTRFADESFVSHALVGRSDDETDDETDAEPTAFLAGTVLRCDTLTTEATGETFHALQVRTAGFTATVCVTADQVPDPPTEGMVVAGTCWLVLDVPALWSLDVGSLTDLMPTRRKRWWHRRRAGRPGAAPASAEP